MSDDLTGDPDVDALLAGGNVQSVTGDPDMDAVIHENGAKPMTPVEKLLSREVTTGPQGFINGAGEIVGKGILNVPYGVVHGVADIVRRASGNPDAPESSIEKGLQVPLSPNARAVADSFTDMHLPGDEAVTADEAKNYTGKSPVGQFVKTYVAPVAGDVAAAAPGISVLGRRWLRTPDPLANPQDVVNQSAAGQSMGAAGATTDISGLSQPVKDVIAATKPEDVHQQALLNHIQAEKHGLVGDAALTKGQAQRDPVQFSEEQNRSTDPKMAARLANQNTALVDDLDRIRQEAAPSQVHNDVVANGRAVVDDLKAYDEPIKAQISANYKALADANGGTFPVGGKTLASNIEAALEKNNRQGMLPADIQRTVDGLRDGKQMTFDDYERFRSDLADASRTAQNGRERNALSLTRQEVENLPLLPGAERLKGLADTARQSAKARFNAMEADPAYKAAVDDVDAGNARGQPSPLADRFIDNYMLNAPKSQLDLSMAKLGDEGRGAVATHTLNTVKKMSVGGTGIVTPAATTKALAKFDPKLDSLLPADTAQDLREFGQVVHNVKAPPAGSSIAPKSGVLVRNALEAGGEHLANVATKGGYGVAKTLGFIKLPGSGKFVKDALAPGAGIQK